MKFLLIFILGLTLIQVAFSEPLWVAKHNHSDDEDDSDLEYDGEDEVVDQDDEQEVINQRDEEEEKPRNLYKSKGAKSLEDEDERDEDLTDDDRDDDFEESEHQHEAHKEPVKTSSNKDKFHQNSPIKGQNKQVVADHRHERGEEEEEEEDVDENEYEDEDEQVEVEGVKSSHQRKQENCVNDDEEEDDCDHDVEDVKSSHQHEQGQDEEETDYEDEDDQNDDDVVKSSPQHAEHELENPNTDKREFGKNEQVKAGNHHEDEEEEEEEEEEYDEYDEYEDEDMQEDEPEEVHRKPVAFKNQSSSGENNVPLHNTIKNEKLRTDDQHTQEVEEDDEELELEAEDESDIHHSDHDNPLNAKTKDEERKGNKSREEEDDNDLEEEEEVGEEEEEEDDDDNDENASHIGESGKVSNGSNDLDKKLHDNKDGTSEHKHQTDKEIPALSTADVNIVSPKLVKGNPSASSNTDGSLLSPKTSTKDQVSLPPPPTSVKESVSSPPLTATSEVHNSTPSSETPPKTPILLALAITPAKDTSSSPPPIIPSKATIPSALPAIPAKDTSSPPPPTIPSKATISSLPVTTPTKDIHPLPSPVTPAGEAVFSVPPSTPTLSSFKLFKWETPVKPPSTASDEKVSPQVPPTLFSNSSSIKEEKLKNPLDELDPSGKLAQRFKELSGLADSKSSSSLSTGSKVTCVSGTVSSNTDFKPMSSTVTASTVSSNPKVETPLSTSCTFESRPYRRTFSRIPTLPFYV